MTSDRLNKWLTLGANVGVLIGIVLLIFELNQNREMIRAQTRNDIAQNALSILSLTATNEKLSEIVMRANSGDELTPSEYLMYVTRSESIFRHFENTHYQYRQGMFDDDEYQKHLATVTSVISRNNGLLVYWCTYKSMYSVPFGNDMDSLLGSDACD